jgi:DNA primase catalytic core
MSSRDYKEQVIAAVPIESYIGRYVPLKRAGKRLTGLCPFHGEKTPSFSVTPEKGLFYCFGCGKGGDLLRFVMDYEGLSFPEALETLGRFAGIEKPKNFGGRKNDPREKLYDLNERVARSFTQYLQSSEGKDKADYLQSRGLTADTLDAFGLGGSPESWEWLRLKYPDHEKDLVHLGLLKAGQQEGRPPYDFFRDRVMFPIRDAGGRYVAFGGRAMPGADKQAKYINSPESSVFHKSGVLYGLYQGLSEIRSKGECFLVEGYMDVIGLHQAGYRTACAPLGTALTPEHLKLIARYTSSLTCIFDGDRAGRNAALKFARLSIEQGGLRSRVILLPAGQDPFDLALQLPAPRLERILGEEYRVPAERFYLLEVMFPGRFTGEVAQADRISDPAFESGSGAPGDAAPAASQNIESGGRPAADLVTALRRTSPGLLYRPTAFRIAPGDGETSGPGPAIFGTDRAAARLGSSAVAGRSRPSAGTQRQRSSSGVAAELPCQGREPAAPISRAGIRTGKRSPWGVGWTRIPGWARKIPERARPWTVRKSGTYRAA